MNATRYVEIAECDILPTNEYVFAEPLGEPPLASGILRPPGQPREYPLTAVVTDVGPGIPAARRDHVLGKAVLIGGNARGFTGRNGERVLLTMDAIIAVLDGPVHDYDEAVAEAPGDPPLIVPA